MEKTESSSLTPNRKRNTALLALMALEGIIALAALLAIPSEAGSARLFGFSLQRLGVALAAVGGVAVLAGFALAEWRQPAWWRRLAERAARFCASPARLFGLVAFLFTLFLVILAFLALYVSPAASELVILRSLAERMGLLLIWIELLIVQVGLLIFSNPPVAGRAWPFLTPLRRAVLLAIATIIYVIALRIFVAATWDLRMGGLESFIFLPAAVALGWGLAWQFFRERPWYAAASRIFLLLFLGVLTYTIYRQTAQWMDWRYSPIKAYWNELANAFLNGRLYLINPPAFHDLTFFNGQWYVPNPPLPALVVLPLVALFGLQNVDMILFSIVCSAINMGLVYLVLEEASARGLIPTDRSANLWLVALFGLGTTYWWLSILGQMWFTSQVLTVTFSALAVLLALKKASPWLAGLCLGLAMLSRPNVFTLWPALAGIAIYLGYQKPGGGVNWKGFLGWAVQSAVPMGLAVLGLLYYNYIRFGNFFDFGYVTINGAPDLVEAAQTYGLFNFHFFAANFNVMFLKLPQISLSAGCLYYSPTFAGTSILAMTPAFIYVFRRFKLNWWSAGAWLAVILSIGALLLYHNTGDQQLGYRYLMDFVVPLLLLLAVGIGPRPSWLFKALALLSMALTAAGILWWFGRWPCTP